METVSVRYIVHDVDQALAFYTTHLKFDVVVHPGPGFAMLARGNLRLLLNKPGGGGGAGQSLPDGSVPEPGGWNRIQLPVDNLAEEFERLRVAGCQFRSEIIVGNGGKQALLEDPSSNLVELFEPLQRPSF